MNHPYEEYENTPIWTFVNEAVQQLVVNALHHPDQTDQVERAAGVGKKHKIGIHA